ncbi:MAG: hypothetical protein ACRDYD_06115 [Acidimicrobiales bacterium]
MGPPEPAGAAPGPAFYVSGRGPWRDVRAVLHPPYTAWHLSYVVLGACLAPTVRWSVLGAALGAFFLAVGVGAHALDELRGRPLGTELPSRALAGAGALGVAGAVALGAVGVAVVGVVLVPFIVVGAALVLAYNLELMGGRLHTETGFALAWGAFPVLTGYVAEARGLSLSAVVAAVAAAGLSRAQRELSSPARTLRRRALSASGGVQMSDGSCVELDRARLLAPLEGALRALSWSMVALVTALALSRAGW